MHPTKSLLFFQFSFLLFLALQFFTSLNTIESSATRQQQWLSFPVLYEAIPETHKICQRIRERAYAFASRQHIYCKSKKKKSFIAQNGFSSKCFRSLRTQVLSLTKFSVVLNTERQYFTVVNLIFGSMELGSGEVKELLKELETELKSFQPNFVFFNPVLWFEK